MTDYIKREDAINIINYWWGDSIAQWLVKKIKNVPSADVAPVRHGHWVEDEVQIHVEKTYHCSECDCLAWGEDEKTRYCPTCGARMSDDDEWEE